MNNSIRKKIKSAFETERKTERLEGVVRERLAKQDGNVDEREVARIRQLACSYIEQVPDLMDRALQASRDTDLEDDLRNLLKFAQEYWREGNDVVPDNVGLFGVLDDAYCTCRLIQLLSKRFEDEVGTPLFENGLEAGNELARTLLGRRAVAKLEAMIKKRMAHPENPLPPFARRVAQAPAIPLFPLPARFLSPFSDGAAYGTRAFDQEVEARLGTMGVIFKL